ncbi:MAG: peptide chain release factor aRF-1 [Nitrososphaerales archaeon]
MPIRFKTIAINSSLQVIDVMNSKADSVTLYKMRKILAELSTKKGRGTELVSLYIPPKRALHEVLGTLKEEYGTASYIKSDSTRTHVQDALVKIMQRLKLYDKTPENGLAIFCGALPPSPSAPPGSEVLQLYEVLPHKPIQTYLYRCVSPDTRILLDDGTEKTIGELKNCWRHHNIMSYDGGRRKLIRAPIQRYLNFPLDGRKAYSLTVESGRRIIATEDHPFFTPRGWVRLQQLKHGDMVCVLPLPDLPLNSASNSRSDQVIVSEESLLKLPYSPLNLRLAIRRLKKRGILPLTKQNFKLQILARFLGHLFSIGSVIHTIERRNNGSYSYFTLDLCVGSKADEDELRNDVSKLGSKMPDGREVTYTMQINGRTYTARTRHIKLRDIALCALLMALGAPVGDKVKSETEIPRWLTEAPLNVQREFLAAYLGGDGGAPQISGYNLCGASRLVFHRIEEQKERGLKFAYQLSQLFANFGVVVNSIRCAPGYKRKDGHKTVKIELRFKLSEDNMLRLYHAIGFRYCSKKALKASLVGEYLRVKSLLRKEAKKAMAQAQEMRSQGMTIKSISKSLGLSERTVSRWTRGLVKTPKTPTNRLLPFNKWLKVARKGLVEPLLWEQVFSIEPTKLSDVRDLTLSHRSHSFFANGFLVHNCDDHFHLEPLLEMIKEEKIMGIISIDNTEAGLGIVIGNRVEVVDVVTSGVSGKHRAGGQSARRFERLREAEINDYFNRVARHATKVFLEQYKIKSLILGGPGPTKDYFLKGEYLDYRLQKNVLAVVDTSYSGREGIRETIERAESVLQDLRIVEERELVKKFLNEVSSDKGLVVYGVNEVIDSLNKGNAHTILVSEDIGLIYLQAVCKKCGMIKEAIIDQESLILEKQKLISERCSSCGSNDIEIIEKDFIDFLADKAMDSGAKVEVISSKSEEGVMFKSFGGVGALLRYR